MNLLPGNLWKDAKKLRAEKQLKIRIQIGKHQQAIKKLELELEQFPCVNCGREGCIGNNENCDRCAMWTAQYNVFVANGQSPSAKALKRQIDAHHCGWIDGINE